MYVLDTNILIYFFKGKGRVAERMFMEKPADIGIPAIVLYELETGIAKAALPQKRTVQLKQLLQVASVLPFGTKEAKASAQISAALEKIGEQIGPIDVLIAGTAMATQSTLVSHNVVEFNRVEGLKTQDWF
jgi:tRNA(fMet)-specific endonuclease VapC